MGCKVPISTRKINVDGLNITAIRIQSASATFNVGFDLHFSKLGNFCHYNSTPYIFEPELFPALRLTSFNPLCINVFASGKCTILCLRHLCFQKYVKRVKDLINRSGCIHLNQQNATEKVDVRKNGFATLQCQRKGYAPLKDEILPTQPPPPPPPPTSMD